MGGVKETVYVQMIVIDHLQTVTNKNELCSVLKRDQWGVISYRAHCGSYERKYRHALEEAVSRRMFVQSSFFAAGLFGVTWGTSIGSSGWGMCAVKDEGECEEVDFVDSHKSCRRRMPLSKVFTAADPSNQRSFVTKTA